MQNDSRQTALLFSWFECLCGRHSLNLFSPVLITEDVVLNKNNMLSDIYCTAEENNTLAENISRAISLCNFYIVGK